MIALKNRFRKLSDKILMKQVKQNNLNPCVCGKCNKNVKNAKLCINGKTFDKICDNMCSQFDVYSVKSMTPEIKKSMEKYFEDAQTKYTKPIYLCNECYNKSQKTN